MKKLLVVALVIGGLCVGTKQVVLADGQTQLLDSDGVQMLYPSAPGSRFQLSRKDPNAMDRFVIEKGTHCVMLTYSPRNHGSIVRFAKELTHPQYDYITLTPAFSASLLENARMGLSLSRRLCSKEGRVHPQEVFS